MEKNKVILRSMINLSRIVKNIKEARTNLGSASDYTRFFIVKGDVANSLSSKLNNCVHDCLYVEEHLRQAISESCLYLDGFDVKHMDPVNYISTNDIKNKCIDICKGNRVTATISLDTGKITKFYSAEEKSPVEKS